MNEEKKVEKVEAQKRLDELNALIDKVFDLVKESKLSFAECANVLGLVRNKYSELYADTTK